MKLNDKAFLRRIENLERKYGADPASEKAKKRLEELLVLLQEYHTVCEELKKDPNDDAAVQVVQIYEKTLACPNKCYSDISRCFVCVQNRDTSEAS